eukprot:CAMPEP_0201568300 /NCGR_PEP_ID=MMETSP0190_2-20130828/9294_1 /ASSEMBLY_ACC=CAM_ASM_000263 /TAXON_ID=37353 /ORGANISM="Rosalina sp." /LENGTH=220 /DNA_ID=CAMNT_0047989249 /DNA_START=40 /DNA_END=702 /DNA_ORIENTATION=+
MAEQAAKPEEQPKEEEPKREEPKQEETPAEEQPKEEKPKDEPKPDEEANKNDDDNKANEAKVNDEDDKPGIDFSGSWTLKSSSKSIDEYYKSEGWSYMMRKFAPMIAMKQIVKQEGNKLTIQVIVGPGGKFANETSTAIIGSGEETEYKDKDGLCRATSEWNEDKTAIIGKAYRVDDKKRTYESIRQLSTTSDKKMIITTTNNLGKTLVQNFELDAPEKK